MNYKVTLTIASYKILIEILFTANLLVLNKL